MFQRSGRHLLILCNRRSAEQGKQPYPWVSTIILLIVANGLDNIPALRLYLAYGFKTIGMYMALCNVNSESVRKAFKCLEGSGGQIRKQISPACFEGEA